MKWRDYIDESVDALLDVCESAPGPVDLVSMFTYPLPVRVICAVLGLPDELRDVVFSACQKITVGPSGSDREDGLELLYGSVADLVHHQPDRLLPGMIKDLLASAEETSTITTTEISVWTAGLVIPGHESTASLLAALLNDIVRLPRDVRPRSSDEIAAAVEDGLRRHPPFPTATWRFADSEVAVGEYPMPPRTPVLLNVPAANHALSEVAPDAHVTFGLGPHFCVGASLARLEAARALDIFLTRFPDAELVDPEPSWVSGMALRGITNLPVTLAGRGD